MKSLIALAILFAASTSAYALDSVCEINEREQRVRCIITDGSEFMDISFRCGADMSCQEKRDEYKEKVSKYKSIVRGDGIFLCMIHPDC